MHPDEKPQYGKLDYLKCQITAQCKGPLTSVASLLVTTTKLPLLIGIQGEEEGAGGPVENGWRNDALAWTASRAPYDAGFPKVEFCCIIR